MAELILKLSNRLVFSKRRRCVRHGFLWFVTNGLLVGAIIFILEIILILLGLGNIFVPLSGDFFGFLSR
jgi:hypothetical protein